MICKYKSFMLISHDSTSLVMFASMAFKTCNIFLMCLCRSSKKSTCIHVNTSCNAVCDMYCFQVVMMCVICMFPGGYDVWRACLLSYAEQLEEKRNFNMAAVYYLTLGDVYKAINVFKDNGLFK